MGSWRRASFPGVFAAMILALCVGLFPAHASIAATGSTFVFFEKFPSDNPNQWDVRKLGDGSRTYLAGDSYHIVRPRPGTMRGWPLKVKVPTGFQFNLKLQLTAGVDPYEGVTFWDDLANNFTLFVITPDGRAGLFKHSATGYKTLVDWRSLPQLHKGTGAINSLSVNLDPLSGAQGRTLLVNGVPLGKACKDSWRTAMGQMPAPPTYGFFVGVLAGSYRGSTEVTVLRASMYDGTRLTPAKPCA